MKNSVLAIVLFLAVGVSACDTGGVIEPVQEGVTPVAVSASDAVAISNPLKTLMFNQLVGEAQGNAQLYMASGEIRYSIVRGVSGRGSCEGYSVYTTIDGVISTLANDNALWTFHGQQTVPICMGSAPYVLTLTRLLEGREDGAFMRLTFTVTESGMELEGLWIEIPSGSGLPVAD